MECIQNTLFSSHIFVTAQISVILMSIFHSVIIKEQKPLNLEDVLVPSSNIGMVKERSNSRSCRTLNAEICISEEFIEIDYTAFLECLKKWQAEVKRLILFH